MEAETIVNRNGDTQLWVVSGDEWELPVLADPFGEPVTHYRLRPPLDAGITQEMLVALDARVLAIRVPAETNHVIVKHEDLQTIGRKAPGITPGYYLRWPGQAQTAGKMDGERLNPAPVETEAGRDFCIYLHQLTGVAEFPVLRLVWKAICQYGPQWMMEKKKPLDFGFCKIFPSPYRANWKGLLSTRFPTAWKTEVMLSEQFTEQTTNTVLAAVSKGDHICYYSLEVVPHGSWRKYADEFEEKRRSKMGPIGYAEFWRRSIGKLHPYLMEAFRWWANSIRIPCGQLGNGILFGGRPIIPWVPPGRILPQALVDPGAGCVVHPTGLPHLRGPGGVRSLPPEARRVSSLPNIQPDPRHLRIVGEQGPKSPLPEPTNGADGAAGVRLQSYGEGEEPEGDVLDEGSGV